MATVSKLKTVFVLFEVNPAATILAVWIAFEAYTLPVTVRLAETALVPMPTLEK
jgi:hypothetical protein